jgi:hypothetical protein
MNDSFAANSRELSEELAYKHWERRERQRRPMAGDGQHTP